MKSRVPNNPHWRRTEGKARWAAPPDTGPTRRRLPIVFCLLAVLGISLGAASVRGTAGRPAPARPEAAAAAVAAPGQGEIATYTASITNGATQNDLYDWLTGRAGTIVHVVLSISKPVAASLKTRPQAITMSSNCSTASPPPNCAKSLNLAGTRYLLYGDGSGLVTLVNNVYKVDAYVAVDPVTLDQKGFYTLPLRIVTLNGSGEGEEDE